MTDVVESIDFENQVVQLLGGILRQLAITNAMLSEALELEITEEDLDG